MNALWAAAAGGGAAWALGIALLRPGCDLLARWGMARPNYAGRRIPTGAGALVAGLAVVAGVLSGRLFPHHFPLDFSPHPFAPGHSLPATNGACLLAIAWFALLGLADDLWGDRSVGGLRGHFRRLLTQGRWTSGTVKAVGGAAGAVAISSLIAPSWPERLPAALVIALGANALNLLDTRPGRVTALYLFGWAMLESAAFACGRRWLPAAPALLAGSALAFLPLDRGRRAMLGDAGSNALGAALGTLAAGLGNACATAVLAVALLWLHWRSECGSLNAAIARRAWASRLDAWLQGPDPQLRG